MRVLGYASVAMSGALAVTTATASPSQWSVIAPAEWEDVSVAVAQQPDVQKQQSALMARDGTMEIVAYRSPTEDSLFVIFMRMAATTNAAGRAAREFEAGAHDSSSKLGSEKSYTLHERNNTLIAEQVIEASRGIISMRRLTGVNELHLMSVAATCIGPQQQCASALQSLTLDSTGFQSLGVGNIHASGVNYESDAYKLGQAIGRLLGAAVVVLLLLWLLVRIRRKKQPAEKNL